LGGIRDEVKLSWRKDARLRAQGEVNPCSAGRTLTGWLALCFDVDNAISFEPASMKSTSTANAAAFNRKTSALLMGSRTRLLGASGLTALLWLAVAWAFEWDWKLTQVVP
jgi:hypothetical protein